MEMEKIEFGYSMKNIGLPSQKEYLTQLTLSCEKFVRNLRWRANFFLNPSTKPEKETYDFRSIKAAPKIKELEKHTKFYVTLIKNMISFSLNLFILTVLSDQAWSPLFNNV